MIGNEKQRPKENGCAAGESGRLPARKGGKSVTVPLAPLIGLAALAWFLIRVIPRPSRAAYPCQRIAAPLASGFLAYLAALFASAFCLDRLKQSWKRSRYPAALAAVALIIPGEITAARITRSTRHPG